MMTSPTFVSEQEYVVRRNDAGFWRPYVTEILKRHDLADAGQELEGGVGPTYPTFLHGDVVVKLFGYQRWWREGLAAERAAHAVLAIDPLIAAPRLLAEGRSKHLTNRLLSYLPSN
jgi:hygromycin-B 7''-O-kinase